MSLALRNLGEGSHERAGVFTFGGIDTVNCGPLIDYRPIKPLTQRNGTTKYHWWLFDVEEFSLGNQSSTKAWLGTGCKRYNEIFPVIGGRSPTAGFRLSVVRLQT